MTYIHSITHVTDKYEDDVNLFTSDQEDHEAEIKEPLDEKTQLNPFLEKLVKLFNIEYEPDNKEYLDIQFNIEVKPLI